MAKKSASSPRTGSTPDGALAVAGPTPTTALPPPFIAIYQPPPAHVAAGSLVTVKAQAKTAGETAFASLIDAALGSETALVVTGGSNAPQTTFNAPAAAGTYIVVMGLASNGTTVASDSATFAVP